MDKALLKKYNGQAMIEFVVAIFAVVIIITGITEFIGLAAKRSEIFATLRGDVGKRAIERQSLPLDEIDLNVTPAVVKENDALLRNYVNGEEKDKVELSKGMKNFIFNGKVDSITVRDEVWLPSFKLSGFQEDANP